MATTNRTGGRSSSSKAVAATQKPGRALHVIVETVGGRPKAHGSESQALSYVGAGIDQSAKRHQAGAITLWNPMPRGGNRASSSKSFFRGLLARMNRLPQIDLFEAVEAGVPAVYVVATADALGEKPAKLAESLGISATTFRRKLQAEERLPEADSHRVMGLLRVAAAVKRILDESGDPEEVKRFDLEAWVRDWAQEPQPQLHGRTPLELMRNPEGQRAVEQMLERMRGGVPA